MSSIVSESDVCKIFIEMPSLLYHDVFNKSVYLIDYESCEYRCAVDGFNLNDNEFKQNMVDINITIELNFNADYNQIRKIKRIIKKILNQIGINRDNCHIITCDLDYIFNAPGDYGSLENIISKMAIMDGIERILKINKLISCIDVDFYDYVSIYPLLLNFNIPRFSFGSDIENLMNSDMVIFYKNNKKNLDMLYEKFYYGKNTDDIEHMDTYLIKFIEIMHTKETLYTLRGYING